MALIIIALFHSYLILLRLGTQRADMIMKYCILWHFCSLSRTCVTVEAGAFRSTIWATKVP